MISKSGHVVWVRERTVRVHPYSGWESSTTLPSASRQRRHSKRATTVQKSFDDAAIGMALVADGRFLWVNWSLCEVLAPGKGVVREDLPGDNPPLRPRCGSRPSAQDVGREIRTYQMEKRYFPRRATWCGLS